MAEGEGWTGGRRGSVVGFSCEKGRVGGSGRASCCQKQEPGMDSRARVNNNRGKRLGIGMVVW